MRAFLSFYGCCMDTGFFTAKRHYLDESYLAERHALLISRGYTEKEVAEIHRRAMAWLEENIEEHPGLKTLAPLRRDYSAALAEVLADGADLAAGHFA